MRNTLSIILCWLLVGISAAYAYDAHDIIEHLQKKYDSIHDASIVFTQRAQFAVTKSIQEFSGSLSLKKGNKYRIELIDRTIVTDGKAVWSYTKANNQVVIDTFRDDPKSFTLERVLMSIPKNYNATVLGKEKIGVREASIVQLLPRSGRSILLWMKIWVDENEWLMRKMEIMDRSETLTTYTISEIKLNTGISDSRFQFDPPRGVEVIDLR